MEELINGLDETINLYLEGCTSDTEALNAIIVLVKLYHFNKENV